MNIPSNSQQIDGIRAAALLLSLRRSYQLFELQSEPPRVDTVELVLRAGLRGPLDMIADAAEADR